MKKLLLLLVLVLLFIGFCAVPAKGQTSKKELPFYLCLNDTSKFACARAHFVKQHNLQTTFNKWVVFTENGEYFSANTSAGKHIGKNKKVLAYFTTFAECIDYIICIKKQ